MACISQNQDLLNAASDAHLRRLLELYQPEVDQRETVFLILPKSDFNSAFAIKDRTTAYRDIELLARRYKIEWIRTGKLYKITTAMSQVNAKISHLVIFGHGVKNGIVLKNSLNGIIYSHQVSTSAFPNLLPEAHIIFDSCDVGIAGGIAEKFSTVFPQATCYAPRAKAFSDASWIFLDSDNKPAMIQLDTRKETTKLITKVFRNKLSQDLDVSKEMDALVALVKMSSKRQTLGYFLTEKMGSFKDPRVYDLFCHLAC